MAQDGSKSASAFKMAFKMAQDCPRCPKMASKMFQDAPKPPKMAPCGQRARQGGPAQTVQTLTGNQSFWCLAISQPMAIRSLKMAPRWSKRAPREAQESPKTAPRAPKSAPRAPQERPP
eukprot:1955991-Pyramimonas_sp.AAC.1